MSYFKTGKQTTANVTFALEGKKKEAREYRGQTCYSAVTQHLIPAHYQSLLIKEAVGHVPYERKECLRWVNDLNEIGFPCHFVSMGTHLKIRIKFKDYKSKTHMVSTLLLLRALWEQGMNRIPDVYFQAMDANPNANKLEEIQKAHKNKSLAKNGYWYNTNHTVTSYCHPHEIEKEELFKRFEQGPSVYGHIERPGSQWGAAYYGGPLNISTIWKAAPKKKEGERIDGIYYD
jgi:hypothetical protein